MDAEMAERVFGAVWNPVPVGAIVAPDETHWLQLPGGPRGVPILARRRLSSVDYLPSLKHYSTDIAAAMLVANEVQRRLNVTLRLVIYPYSRTYAAFTMDVEDDAFAEGNGEHHTSLAICLAARAALVPPSLTEPTNG